MLSSFVLKSLPRTHTLPHLFFYIKPYFCAPSFFNSLFYILIQHHTNTGIYGFFFPSHSFILSTFYSNTLLLFILFCFFFAFDLLLLVFFFFHEAVVVIVSALHHHTITSNICFALITYQPTRLQPPTTTKFKFFLFF